MADIKTRDVVKGTIKKIDKAAIAADRMRSAYVQTKEKAEHTMILSILVDTFSSRISLTMPPSPKPHNTACVLS